jgi:hypothetical protein
MSSADKTKLDGIASGAEVNVNADWNAASGDAQILNKPTRFPPSTGGWGPLILNRFRGGSFSSSNYAPNGQTPSGMFSFSPVGNTVEGWGFDGTWPRIFNPVKVLGVGVDYVITAYVRVTDSFNDGVHCQLRSFDGTSASIVSGLGDFGGGAGATDRIHFATSNTLSSSDTFYSFAFYFGAYGNNNNSNGATIQDTVLVFRVL